MINVDTTEKRLNRKNVKKRNSYIDLWFLLIIIIYVIGCYRCFNSFNPFTSTWGYFRVTSNTEVEVKLDNTTTMIRQNRREGYLTTLVNELEKSNFTIEDRQTHLLIVDKDGIKITYKFLDKELLGGKYTLVIKEENN